jgi:hypothetical protein
MLSCRTPHPDPQKEVRNLWKDGNAGMRAEARFFEVLLPLTAPAFVFGSISKQMKNEPQRPRGPQRFLIFQATPLHGQLLAHAWDPLPLLFNKSFSSRSLRSWRSFLLSESPAPFKAIPYHFLTQGLKGAKRQSAIFGTGIMHFGGDEWC